MNIRGRGGGFSGAGLQPCALCFRRFRQVFLCIDQKERAFVEPRLLGAFDVSETQIVIDELRGLYGVRSVLLLSIPGHCPFIDDSHARGIFSFEKFQGCSTDLRTQPKDIAVAGLQNRQRARIAFIADESQLQRKTREDLVRVKPFGDSVAQNLRNHGFREATQDQCVAGDGLEKRIDDPIENPIVQKPVHHHSRQILRQLFNLSAFLDQAEGKLEHERHTVRYVNNALQNLFITDAVFPQPVLRIRWGHPRQMNSLRDASIEIEVLHCCSAADDYSEVWCGLQDQFEHLPDLVVLLHLLGNFKSVKHQEWWRSSLQGRSDSS